MSTLLLSSSAPRGLRPVNMRRDLAQIADLVELCFEDTMDRAGRAAVEEMRLMSRFGMGLWLLQGLDSLWKGLMQGFVWVEDGRVIGNVSIYPAGYDNTWVIANVAVHPDFRGRGIAYQLCQAALDRITSERGQSAILQVDHDNDVAQRLYHRLGFRVERAFTRWHWASHNRAPNPLPNMPYITYRTYQDWRAEYELVKAVRPPTRGGIGWLKPTQEKRFRLTVWKMLINLLSPVSHEHWIVRGAEGGLDALLISEVSFGAASVHFDMLVHPTRHGELEEALLNFIVRRASFQYRGASTDHPADDTIAEEALRRCHFIPKRTLIHMRWQG